MLQYKTKHRPRSQSLYSLDGYKIDSFGIYEALGSRQLSFVFGASSLLGSDEQRLNKEAGE
jgi:hypothetical protein